MKELHIHRKQLKLGMTVNCLDGRAGKISKVIADPESHRPTHLVVKRGRLRTTEVVVPVSLVDAVDLESVQLAITLEALRDLPVYEYTVHKGRYEIPKLVGRPPVTVYTPPTNKGYMVLKQRAVPERSLAIEKGLAIRDSYGREVGQVVGLIVDGNEQIGKYIVFRNPLSGSTQLITTELIEDVTADSIHLRIARQYLDGLPIFQPEYANKRLFEGEER